MKTKPPKNNLFELEKLMSYSSPIALESVTDYAIMTLDSEGRIISWNRGAENIFGYSETEILGKYADLIYTPEDCAAETLKSEMQQAVNEGRAIDERWHLRKDGSQFYTNGVTTPIISNDKLLGF